MQRTLEGGVGVEQRRQVPVVDPPSVDVLCELVYCWRPAGAPGQRLDGHLDLAFDRELELAAPPGHCGAHADERT